MPLSRSGLVITDDEGVVNRGTIAKLCREVAALRASGSML